MAPSFSGPHAAELQEAYQNTKSDYFRLVIEDETVTEAEYLESQNRAKMCLEALGFTDIKYFSEGGSQASNPPDLSEDDAHRLKVQCEEQEGLMDTEIWYSVLRVNPDNLDWGVTIRDCMVEKGLIEPGATVDEMEQWLRSGEEGVGSLEVQRCLTDPLGKTGLS